MNQIAKEYRNKVKKAIKQYKANPNPESLQAVQIAMTNYSMIKRTNGVK